LTAEEVELLVRLIRDPTYRERMGNVLRQTVLNPELWRDLGDQISRTYLNPELWRELGQAVSRTLLDPELWKQMGRVLSETYLNPEAWHRAAQLAARDLSTEAYRSLGPTVTDAVQGYVSDSAPAAAARDFERELSTSEAAGPHPERDAPLWWWLYTRDERMQVGLFVAAVAALDRLNRAVAGDIYPQPLKDAIDVLLAVVAVLLMYLDYKLDDDETDNS
jgi:hypothetical protein